MADDKSLKHDALVARIVGDPAKPADTVWLTGFLGHSSEAGHTRVYSDPSFETYVDVPTDAIIHTEPLPKDQSPLGGSYVWLKKDAEVLHGKVGTERTKAKFLEGPIQQAFASQAAAAAPAPGAGVGILPTDNPGCGPTRFLPLCHSPNLPGCQSPLPFCNSAIDACPTRILQFCPTHVPAHCPTHYPAFCPSHFVPCPTQHPHPCPSFAPSPCPHTQWPQHCITLPFCPTETGCPSQLQHCPSPLPHCLIPPITVNNQQCVASGGGPGCPVLPGTPVETPQVHPGGVPAQAFAAGPGAGQPHTLAGCQVSGVNACFTPNCQTPVWQCPIPPSHVGCISFPIQCPTPHCPPTPLHGPCQSVGVFCFTPPPSQLLGGCHQSVGLFCFTPPPSQFCPSPPPHLCFSPLPQCQVHTPVCPVSPPCPVTPLCPQTVNCPISPNCPPATGGCPFGPGGGGGPQF